MRASEEVEASYKKQLEFVQNLVSYDFKKLDEVVEKDLDQKYSNGDFLASEIPAHRSLSTLDQIKNNYNQSKPSMSQSSMRKSLRQIRS